VQPAGSASASRLRAPTTDVPAIGIIGAGLGGIATAVALTRAGILNFTVFEQSDGPGGVWHDNHYPGCEVDVPIFRYSNTFTNYSWTENYASQKELECYCESIIDQFSLSKHLQFNSKVEQIAWDESWAKYQVRLADGRSEYFSVVVSAVGLLSNPKVPDWPGLDEFRGPKFHSARWEHEHDLSGKTVAVVGTGSSGTQVVGTLAPSVGQLLVFQREPGWIWPKKKRSLTPEEPKTLRAIRLCEVVASDEGVLAKPPL